MIDRLFEYVVKARRLFLPIMRKKGEIPVVSVGNIVCGGAGKTPFVSLLQKKLPGCVVLSRGYKGKMKGVVQRETPAAICGDEPKLLSRNGMVIVGANRGVSLKKGVTWGAKVALLDDGMQQRYLKADVNIGVINALDPFGGMRFLPKGRLRDHPRILGDMDYLVVNNAPERWEALVEELRRYSRAPVVGVRPELASMKGARVALFCALGNPQGFFEAIERAGGQIVDTLYKRDHAPFLETEIEGFALRAKEKGAEKLVCTEKDFVKLERRDYSLPLEAPPLELTIVHGTAILEELIDKIKEMSGI